MKHYGIWIKSLGVWYSTPPGAIWWTTSRAVARLTIKQHLPEIKEKCEVKEFPES